jgi:hypothetical protein
LISNLCYSIGLSGDSEGRGGMNCPRCGTPLRELGSLEATV